MIYSLRENPGADPECDAAAEPEAAGLRIVSWNLLHRVGAGVRDVSALIEQYGPDLLLMQEVTEELAALPTIVGGHFFREPMHSRTYGLAAWSPHPLPVPTTLALPVAAVPGRVPPRIAQVVRLGGVSFANVHLSHGQFLNRFQLLRIARSFDGPLAVVGDYNALGPIRLAGFSDVGPRSATHIAKNVVPFRLDRCMVRGLRCVNARALERGASDHRPILLDLDISSAAGESDDLHSSTRPRRSRRDRLMRRLKLPAALGKKARSRR